ncbi:MAG: hybrid sensor histidine kinase/response regulator [Spirochaetes bacterium]|nr:hybrid sensor histidine kinase/response regulator [Spirochaetota bacterium]
MLNRTITAIDDNPTILLMLKNFLESVEFEVIPYENPLEALEFIESEPPDLIICDIDMPELNGFEVHQKLQEKPQLKMIPFVFLTALDDDENIIHGKEIGADDYITKPFKRETLIAAIRGKLKRLTDFKQSQHTEIEKFKKEIISILLHELRTPLTVIHGFTSLLVDSNIDIVKTQQLLNNIKSGGDRLKKLISDIEQITSLENNLYTEKMVEFQLNQLMQQIIRIKKEEIETKKLQLFVSISEELSPLTGYWMMLEDGINRIMDNAIKYNKEEESINIRLHEEDKSIILEISDTGLGIPEEHQDKIFNKFYQVDRQLNEQQGMGLGLTIAEKSIQINKGSIELKSEVGIGTTIKITFPLNN